MKRQGGGAPDTSGAQGSSKRAYSPTLDYTLRFDKDYVPTLIDTLEFTNDYSPSVSDIEQPTDIYQPSVIDIFQPTDIYQPTNEYIYEDTKIYQPTIDYIYEDVKIHQPSDMYIYEDAKIHQPSDIYAVEFVETYAPTYEITTEYVLEYAPTVGGPPPDGDPHKPGARTVDPHGHYLDPEHDDPKGNPADPKGKGKGGKAGKGGKGGKGGPPGKKERDTPVNQNENNNKNSFDIDVDAGDKSPEEKPKPKPAEKKHKPYNGLPTRHYAAAINRLQEDTPHIGHPGLLEVRAQKLAPDSTKDFSQHEVVTLMAFPAPPEGKKKRWCKVKFGTPEEGGGVVDVWQMDADPADVLGATWGKNLKRDKKIGTWSTEKHAWLSGDGEVREGVVIEISWADKQEGGVMWGEEEVRLFLDDD